MMGVPPMCICIQEIDVPKGFVQKNSHEDAEGKNTQEVIEKDKDVPVTCIEGRLTALTSYSGSSSLMAKSYRTEINGANF